MRNLLGVAESVSDFPEQCRYRVNIPRHIVRRVCSIASRFGCRCRAEAAVTEALVSSVGGLHEFVNINSSNYGAGDKILRVNSYWRYPRKVLLDDNGQDLLLTAQKALLAIPLSQKSFVAAHGGKDDSLKKLAEAPANFVSKLRENASTAERFSREYRIELGARLEDAGYLLQQLIRIGRKAISTNALKRVNSQAVQLTKLYVKQFTQPLLDFPQTDMSMSRRRYAGSCLDALRLYLTGLYAVHILVAGPR